MIIPIKTPKGSDVALKVLAHHNGEFTIDICKVVTQFGLERVSGWKCSPYFVYVEEDDEDVITVAIKNTPQLSGKSTKELSDKIKQALQIASKL